jgi:hypothetical protein
MIANFLSAGNSDTPTPSLFSQPKTNGIPLQRPNLAQLAQADLPDFVRHCPVAMKYLNLLAPLDWDNFPERNPNRAWPGPIPHPRAAYIASFLIKLHEDKTYMSNLRDYLVDHPALVWLLGFRLAPDQTSPYGFDVQASLPTARHFGRVLRELPNQLLQFLLTNTVHLLAAELPPELNFGQAVSMDTKHLIAWVKENNPKAYVKESVRLDKARQPPGDPDCKLGCKKKRNQGPAESQEQSGPANLPPTDPAPVTNFSAVDVYYWGYASGVVATKLPGYGEFVLAELTQPFNKGDSTFFFPLMAAVEQRLGRKPKFGAFDAAFDAFYVYDYFNQAGGFAAVPFVPHGGIKDRSFDPQGLPLCPAGLAMPLKNTFICRSTDVQHQRGRYACPLLFPQPTGHNCPIDHQHWPKGGCLLTMATAEGARIRYQLDRDSQAYQELYNQRTATERVNSQAVELGIERPKLRRGSAIANFNTLHYVLINLRALHRLRQRPTEIQP